LVGWLIDRDERKDEQIRKIDRRIDGQHAGNGRNSAYRQAEGRRDRPCTVYIIDNYL